jgi:hypothetical protein
MGDLANAVPYADIYHANASFVIECELADISKTVVSPFDDTHIYL